MFSFDKETWMTRLGVAMIFSALGLGVYGLTQLSYSDEEYETREFCTLEVPFEYKYTYLLVRMRSYPGYLTGDMWLSIHYYGKTAADYIKSIDPYFKVSLEKAYAAGFDLDKPITIQEDKDIRYRIIRDMDGCDEAKRRSSFWQRVKDCLAYIGASVVLLASTFLMEKLLLRQPRS